MPGHAERRGDDELPAGQERGSAAVRAGGDGGGRDAGGGLAGRAEFSAGREGEDVAGRVQAERHRATRAADHRAAAAEGGVRGAARVIPGQDHVGVAGPDPVPTEPAATILPSGWTTAALNASPASTPVGMSRVTRPLRPKVLSGAPLAVNRSKAKSERLPPPEVFVVAPTQRILPPGWTVRLGIPAGPPGKPTAAKPPDPRRVQAPGGTQAHHARVAADQDVAVAEHDHRAGSAELGLARGGQAQVGDHRPVVAEAGVDAAGGAACGERGWVTPAETSEAMTAAAAGVPFADMGGLS